MKKNMLLVLSLLVVSMIGLTSLVSAWELKDYRGESYKAYNEARSNMYHAWDKDCPKGQITGRMSDGSYKCVWPGSNKHKEKNKGGFVNVEDSIVSDSGEETSDEGSDESDDSGSGQEDDEGGCKSDDNDCKEKEVCEEVKEKVLKETCSWKKGKLHCSKGWVWETHEFCSMKLVCEGDEKNE